MKKTTNTKTNATTRRTKTVETKTVEKPMSLADVLKAKCLEAAILKSKTSYKTMVKPERVVDTEVLKDGSVKIQCRRPEMKAILADYSTDVHERKSSKPGKDGLRKVYSIKCDADKLDEILVKLFTVMA